MAEELRLDPLAVQCNYSPLSALLCSEDNSLAQNWNHLELYFSGNFITLTAAEVLGRKRRYFRHLSSCWVQVGCREG